MRIAVIVDAWPVASETFIRRDLSALVDAGARLAVFAVCPATPTAAETDPRIPVTFASALPRQPGHHPAAGWFRNIVRDPAAWPGALRSAGIAARLAPAVAAFAPDVIHAQFLYRPADVARLLAEALRVPWVVSVHARDVFAQPRRRMARRAATARAWIACTERAAAALRPALPSGASPAVAYHALPPRPPPAGRPTPGHLVAVGRFVPKKGLGMLVDACACLYKRGVDVRLRLVGDGPEADALRERAVRGGIADRVTFTGWLAPAEVARVVAEAVAFVAPSVRAADGDRDGIPNALLEAMLAARPVVASDASAAAEAIADFREGRIVPAGRVDLLADTLAGLLGDTAAAERMGLAARRRVLRQFEPQAAAERLLALLRRACAGGPADPQGR